MYCTYQIEFVGMEGEVGSYLCQICIMYKIVIYLPQGDFVLPSKIS